MLLKLVFLAAAITAATREPVLAFCPRRGMSEEYVFFSFNRGQPETACVLRRECVILVFQDIRVEIR